MADHWSAALAALTAAGLRVHDGDPERGAQMPYVVVYRPVGRASADRMDAKPDRIDGEGQVTSVGLTPESVAVVARKARTVLTSRLTVADRNTWRGEHLDSQPIRRDQDVADLTVFYGVDRYRLSSVPAST